LKLAIIAHHPVQYQAGIWREVNKIKKIESEVYYCEKIGVELSREPEFDVVWKWDIDLLSGYKSKFLKNINLSIFGRIFSRINYTLPFDLYRDNCSVILISGYEIITSWLALFSAKILGLKTVWRGEAILKNTDKDRSVKARIKKIILNMFFSQCDVVMFSCSANKDYLEYFGVEKRKLFPIYCSVDNDYFQNEKKKYTGKISEIKKETGIDDDDFVILFVGRFTERKRLIDLIEAINNIQNQNIVLLFVGDGPLKNDMEKLSSKYIIKTIFTGFKNQSEISKYYIISNLFVIISDMDPSPKVLNEAMNFALPVIVSNMCGTASDLVIDNGFIIETGDIDALADKIDYLNNNRELSKEMGSKSNDIVKNFSFF